MAVALVFGLMLALPSAQAVDPAQGDPHSDLQPEAFESLAEFPENVGRIAGTNRIRTAVNASGAHFADEEATDLVLVRSDQFADALTGTPLAAALSGPLLLTSGGSLPTDVRQELERVMQPGGTVHIVGGAAAVSADVVSSIEALGFTVARHRGSDRYSTAVAVADQVAGPQTVFVTTGSAFPDAVAAGAAAAYVGGVVLLSNGSQSHDATDAYLAANPGAEVVAVGGPAAAAYPDATPLVGANRSETAIKVAETYFADAEDVVLARSDDFPDALVGGSVAWWLDAPVLLSRTASLDSAVAAYLCDAPAASGVVMGGASALSEDVAQAFGHRMAGTGC